MDIKDIFLRRCDYQARQTRLTVDYYRIRRRFNVALPITELPHFSYPVRGYQGYPWQIWLLWDLEERINTLGLGYEVVGDRRYRAAAEADLRGLASWESYDDRDFPHLAPSHALRTVILSVRAWTNVAEELQSLVRAACARTLDATAGWVAAEQPETATVEQLIAAPTDAHKLHNIRVIATLALAMAAVHVEDENADELVRWSAAHVRAVLEKYAAGSTEGVGYDGYILDFVADWLTLMPRRIGDEILAHPSLSPMIEQSVHLACPGRVAEPARLSDVEPVHMPFHLSAHAKMGVKGGCRISRWYIDRCDGNRLRSDALYAVYTADRSAPVGDADGPESLPVIASTNYTVTQRTGWDADDLAVVLSSSVSQMSHLHEDRGSIAIGRYGMWYLDDPGYQQYLQTAERTFTTGSAAHNRPILSGAVPTRADTAVVATALDGRGASQVTVDLSNCYPGAATVRRTVFRRGRNAVIVADEIVHDGTIEYHWYGNPDASWGAEDGAACIYHDGHGLFLRCSHAALEQAMVDRLPGSRGGLTLSAEIPAKGSTVVWWSFVFDDSRDFVTAARDERTATWDGGKLALHS